MNILHRLRAGLVGLALVAPANAQSLDDKIDAASQRWQSYQERLQSSDPVIRSETLAIALRDDNQAIRNGALWYALKSRSGLPITFVIPPGSAIDVGSAPNLELGTVTWGLDHRTLQGRTTSQSVLTRVDGELVEGALRLVYASLAFGPGFSGADYAGSRRGRPERHRCTVSLAFQPASNALEGPLLCEGMTARFKARLPLG